MVRRALIALAALCAVALPAAPAASAHAQLDATIPARGAVVPTQPTHVEFAYSESVEGTFGAIRVFDADAKRVDDNTVTHPGATGSKLAVGLKPGLPDGTYTATYRVISSDGHPVEGGLVFSIGKAGAGPARSVGELIGSSRAGTLTEAGARTMQGLIYLATALAVGLLGFLALCWRPAVGRLAGAEPGWEPASEALAARAQTVLLAAVNLGIAAGTLRIVFEGAVASGTTFWAALDPTIVRDVLRTQVGSVWGLRIVAWVALGGALLAGTSRRGMVLRPATLGATGRVVGAVGGVPALALALPALALVVTPALEGHSDTLGPVGLLIPLDALHVLAMSVWLGGLCALLFVVPRATALLEPAQRTRLLAGLLLRFSPLALVSVATLALTGTVAAIAYLTGVAELWNTGYGREILVKIVLLTVLIALGALNRQRLVPALQRIAAAGDAPGAAGRALRASLRAEVALILVVLGVSSVLVDGVPPVSAASGPVNVSKTIGPLDLEATIDPARTGVNELHLYLFRSRDGAPFAGTKELTVTASLPGRQIGPLPVTLRLSGPGHYTADTMQLTPGGTWRFAVTDRVSDFDEYATTFDVRIR